MREALRTELDLKLSGGLRAASEARRALTRFEDRLPPGLLEDVRLLVNELVTNSIRHAGVGRTGWIGLRVVLEGDVLWVEVSDPGGGFHYAPPEPDVVQESGWGLFLVDRIADAWGVVSGEVCSVWFEIDCAKTRDSAMWIAEETES
ncbi:MAG: ATP-binding protein [Actinomycetota bacterium]